MAHPLKFVRRIGRRFASYLPDREVTKDTSDFKIKLITSQFIDFKIYCGMSHEPETIAAIKRLVKPGMTAIDVGANIGWITLHLASLVGSKGHVVAFEPSDWTYERLVQNVRLNNFSWVKTERKAIGSNDVPEVLLTLPRGYRLDFSDTAKEQHVPLAKLDTALSKLDRIDFIKTDTDGYEPAVFDGARAILRNHQPILLFEVAPIATRAAKHDLDQLFSDLSTFGYRFENEFGTAIDPKAEARKLSGSDSINIVARI